MYIDTQEALDEFINACEQASFLTVDTEFLREKTYYPLLCLIQVATDDFEAIIDPLALPDITSLAPLFTDPRKIKVFHAGDQDRIILYHIFGKAVKPVFDTQRAVMLLGLPQQMSLSALVKHYCGINLKKAESFSDWAQRPLTKKQIQYALDDVHYLPGIYEQIVKDLEASNRLDWLQEDLRAMEDESMYQQDVYDVWKRLKGGMSLKGEQLAIAREVAAWRELQAQKRNLPRKWLISDDLVVEVTRKAPESLNSLFAIRGIKEKLGNRLAQDMLQAVQRAKEQPKIEWPVREQVPNNDAGITMKIDLLSALLHYRARQMRIASSFLANHDELVRLAAGQRQNLSILSGWRRELIGEELLHLLHGEISMKLEGDDLKVTLQPQARKTTAI